MNDLVPEKHLISLRYVFVLLAIVSLCLASYSNCRIYSPIGAALLITVALAFVRRIRSLVFVGIAVLALVWMATMADVLWHGPATQYHNRRLAEIAKSNELIGKPTRLAISLFGTPTSRFSTTGGETLNYAPFRYFPHGIFQVHCKEEIVSSIEVYDD